MKKTLCRISGVLALAVLAASPAVKAQEALLVNIPFSFTAGKMTLPAGEYRIQNAVNASPAMLIRSTDRGTAAFLTSNAVSAATPQAQSKLIFRHYGNRYFLLQVWVEGYSRGRELPKSAKEKEQALTAQNEMQDQVTIVARLMR